MHYRKSTLCVVSERTRIEGNNKSMVCVLFTTVGEKVHIGTEQRSAVKKIKPVALFTIVLHFADVSVS